MKQYLKIIWADAAYLILISFITQLISFFIVCYALLGLTDIKKLFSTNLDLTRLLSVAVIAPLILSPFFGALINIIGAQNSHLGRLAIYVFSFLLIYQIYNYLFFALYPPY
jgi:ABC-type molybdate transport system permease subunit